MARNCLLRTKAGRSLSAGLRQAIQASLCPPDGRVCGQSCELEVRTGYIVRVFKEFGLLTVRDSSSRFMTLKQGALLGATVSGTVGKPLEAICNRTSGSIYFAETGSNAKVEDAPTNGSDAREESNAGQAAKEIVALRTTPYVRPPEYVHVLESLKHHLFLVEVDAGGLERLRTDARVRVFSTGQPSGQTNFSRRIGASKPMGRAIDATPTDAQMRRRDDDDAG